MISKPTKMHDLIGGGKKLEQPGFHRESRTFCQKLFPVLARATDLTPNELHSYHTIKSQYVMAYDQQNEAHENLLRRLYKAITQ